MWAIADQLLGSSFEFVHAVGGAQRAHHLETVVGGLAATFANRGGERLVHVWSLGMGLPFDTDTFALAQVSEALTLYYTDVVPPRVNKHIYKIFSVIRISFLDH